MQVSRLQSSNTNSLGELDRQGMVVGGGWGVLILDTRGQAEASEEFREQTVARGSVRGD